MSRLRTVPILGTLAVSFAALGIAQAGTITTTDGTVTVTDVVTPISGSLYQYNYIVTDATGLLAVLDISVTPGISISGLTAPGGSSGFTSTIDTVGSGSAGQEFVSFLENQGMFTATAESGFIFDSPVAPGPATFDVTLFDGATGTGGSVTGPVVAPEPASLPLCVLGGAILLFWLMRCSAFRQRQTSQAL